MLCYDNIYPGKHEPYKRLYEKITPITGLIFVKFIKDHKHNRKLYVDMYI